MRGALVLAFALTSCSGQAATEPEGANTPTFLEPTGDKPERCQTAPGCRPGMGTCVYDDVCGELICLCDPAPTGPTPEPPKAAAPPTLPPPDLACERDEDCAATWHLWVDEARGSCCHGCRTDVGNVTWLAEAKRVCQELGGEGCPTKKCAPLDEVRCVRGACRVR